MPQGKYVWIAVTVRKVTSEKACRGLSSWSPVNSLYIKLPRCLGQAMFPIDTALPGQWETWGVWALSLKSTQPPHLCAEDRSRVQREMSWFNFVTGVLELVVYREVKMWLDCKTFCRALRAPNLLVLWQKARTSLCWQKQRELEMRLRKEWPMPSKVLRRRIEMFAYFRRKSVSPERTEQTLSASILDSLKAELPSHLPSCSPWIK